MIADTDWRKQIDDLCARLAVVTRERDQAIRALKEALSKIEKGEDRE